MSVKEAEFWRSCEEHHALAEHYERNIKLQHPGYITSKRMCPCLKWCAWCGWAITQVKYYDYNGTHPRNFDEP